MSILNLPIFPLLIRMNLKEPKLVQVAVERETLRSLIVFSGQSESL